MGLSAIKAVRIVIAICGRPGVVLAQACATVEVQATTTTTVAHCEPLLDDWPTRCDEQGADVEGIGATAAVCRPEPPAAQLSAQYPY
jgi:hypothetical protein